MFALGCGSKSEPAPDTKAACTTAIDRDVDIVLEKRRARGPMANSPDAKNLMDELAPRLKATLTGLCETDNWAQAVVSCFQTAADIATCRDRLKPEQRQRYTQAMMKAMMSQLGAGNAGHAPPGSGSSN
ncbi:MAG: hypothetical protein H0V17_09625 [Deltaproteobacteria bacterium]|nr:hypothetical protein [Deltaproteobacteria bacterium]